MGIKCLILILSTLVSFSAYGQFQPSLARNNGANIAMTLKGQKPVAVQSYKYENGKVVDKRNQFLPAPKLQSFVGLKEQPRKLSWGGSGEKVRYEVNQKVEFLCRVPGLKALISIPKRGEGEIEDIRSIHASPYVKVKGCDYLIEASNIEYVAEKSNRARVATSSKTSSAQ